MKPSPGQVQTVTGVIPSSELGFTLPHEHVYARLQDFPCVATVAYGGMFGEIHIEDSTRRDELLAFKNKGGKTLVDVTLPAIGRQPLKLREMSKDTGLNLVMGCGWYREPYYPPQDVVDRQSVDDLASVLSEEIVNGVDGTGVCPGIIGEIGVNNSWITAQEERVHRAAARAHLQTGLALTTHSPWSEVGLAQLRIFEDEGVDPARVAIGHACSYPVLGYYLKLLERGAYVQFDNLGQWDLPGYEDRIVHLMLELLQRGHGQRIMLSHDIWNSRQFSFAGGTGYVYLADSFLPRLRNEGVDEALISLMTVENPARFLAAA